MSEIDRDEVASAVIEMNMCGLDTWANVGEHLSCTEVVSLANLFDSVGLTDPARYLVTGHYYSGSVGDEDQEQEEEWHGDDSRVTPELMFKDGEEPY